MPDPNRLRAAVDAVGLAAVLLGLVFVGFEIRQNTAATRAATQQAIFDATLEQQWGTMANERLRELMVMTREDPSWVSATPQTADHLLLERFYFQRFNSLENVFYHQLEGTLDQRLWNGWEGWLRGLASDPLMSHYWGEFRTGYMPDFVEYMDGVLSSGEHS